MAWGMLNFLQLILHLALLSVAYPQKTLAFLIMLVNMANYEIVPTEDYIEMLYHPDLNPVEVSAMFTAFGYDSLNLFANLGMLVFYLMSLLLLVLFL